MKNVLKQSGWTAIAFRVSMIPVLTVIVAACSPVNFATVDSKGAGVTQTGTTSTPTPSPTCSIETVYRKTKIMFLVDASGSNSEYTYNSIGGQNVYTPPSDPAKRFRGGAIDTFFSTYQHKTNFNWSFSTFMGSSAQAYIGSTSNPLFSSNVNDMSNAISTFESNASDNGQTPYQAAIQLATRAVGNDPDLNSADKPNYFIILLSDGFPTDYDPNGQFNSAQMRSDVAALLAKAPGRVSLSTIYYAASSTQIPDAVSILQQIASAGNGQFANVNTSSNTFKIDDVISSGQVCN